MKKNKEAGFKLKRSPLVGSSDEPLVEPSVSMEGELPRSYGSNTIFLIAQEPHWLFTYWDIDISKHPGGPSFLRVIGQEEDLEIEIEVPFETRNWYIPVQRAGETYSVEIGFHRNSEWNPIARSAPAQTPADKVSGSASFDYATIPLHLSFHAMMDCVREALHQGESLMEALARLQRDGMLNSGELAAAGVSAADAKLLLETLLGTEYLESLSSAGLSSADIENKIRVALEEKLSSAGGPSSFGSFESSSGWGSVGLSSWTPAALSSWVAAALSSWAVHAGASWTAPSSEQWVQAVLSSWGGKALSSWGESSGWAPSRLSSWLQAAGSSWAGAAESSGGPFFSSWSEVALSSWGLSSWQSAGGSETLSSPGFGRGFFMNVNAEVIFYGGTDPRAKVSIDGKEVRLNPDGTFRYHFLFPDGKYEIPIVATSPDGVETRSAVLRFERGTAKSGKVDDSAQPALDVPLGAI